MRATLRMLLKATRRTGEGQARRRDPRTPPTHSSRVRFRLPVPQLPGLTVPVDTSEPREYAHALRSAVQATIQKEAEEILSCRVDGGAPK